MVEVKKVLKEGEGQRDGGDVFPPQERR